MGDLVTDTWVEDWHQMKAARAALQEAARLAREAGLTKEEATSEIYIEYDLQEVKEQRC